MSFMEIGKEFDRDPDQDYGLVLFCVQGSLSGGQNYMRIQISRWKMIKILRNPDPHGSDAQRDFSSEL